jgi:hypothetical protein
MSVVEDALGHINAAGITALVTEMIDIPSPMGMNQGQCNFIVAASQI